MIAKDLGSGLELRMPELEEEEVRVAGATWGLVKCRVPLSLRSGAGIRVAVLDTGMDLGHPDFAGRSIMARLRRPAGAGSAQPRHPLHRHRLRTACADGSRRRATASPTVVDRRRQGAVQFRFEQAGRVLAGINWAIANRCAVISMSLGSPAPVHPAYTAAGQAALNNGSLIIAAAGNDCQSRTGAPANSPTIMAVASLDPNLRPSSFSNSGKIDNAAPGRDVFSSVPRPTRMHQERDQHGDAARGRLRRALGRDQSRLAGPEPLEQVDRDRPDRSVACFEGRPRARASAMICAWMLRTGAGS